MVDVIIVGGSYAGLAAALQLVRARRSVLILDAGERRNRFVHAAHGFLGSDGQEPGAIVERGRRDVLAYPTATLRTDRVTQISGSQDHFVVRTETDEHHGRRLILATGIADELPAIPGLRERWGKTVFVCPYCDGYELGLGRIGILATSAMSLHHGMLAAEWAGPGLARFFLNEAFEPEAEQLAELAARKITLERARVREVTGERPMTVHLEGGAAHELEAMFVLPRTAIRDGFAAALGCELDTGPLGPFYKTDTVKETTVPGVFACGDVAQMMGSVSFAVADGARAGASAHQSLVFRPRA